MKEQALSLISEKGERAKFSPPPSLAGKLAPLFTRMWEKKDIVFELVLQEEMD
jgi:hypothetical protein